MRFGGPVDLGASLNLVTLATCPVGKVLLIKSIRLVNNVAGVRDVALGIGDPFYGYNRVARQALAANSAWSDPDTDPVVLRAGEVFQARIISGGAVAGDVTATISGAQLLA